MNLPDELTDEALRRIAESSLAEPGRPATDWPIMWNGMHLGWSRSGYDIARRLAGELLTLRAELAQVRADLEAAQVTVNAVAKVVAPLRGGPLDDEAWGEDLASPKNGALLARMVAQMRADLEAAQASVAIRQTTIDETHLVLDEAGIDREDDEGHTTPLWDRVADLVRECDALRAQADRARAERDSPRQGAAMTLDQLRAELHRLALTSDADRCADALAALTEPLAPPPEVVIPWLKKRGWRTDSVGRTWQTMRRGSRGLVDVPLLVGSRDYARCVSALIGEVAIVEGIRRSRMVADLWAAMKESTHA